MRRSMTLIGMTLAIAMLPLPAALADGAGVFRANCASCHGVDGQGTPGLAPALKGDPFVTGKMGDVLATVKNGRSGDQKRYKNLPIAMPAWDGKLSAADIKAVVSYIRGDLQK
ncbi:MAG TPA: c-type cytochrome [Gammaproteobacteria bacterium]|nr:c-type cytochrome [Gammaproteobacteria bacterium]